MRFQTLVVLVALLLNLPALSQDADYPTLEALSNLEVPAFRYADMVDRMSWMNPNHLPPAQPTELRNRRPRIFPTGFW